MKLITAIVYLATLVSSHAFASEPSMPSATSVPKQAVSAETLVDSQKFQLAYNDTNCMSRCDKQYDDCKKKSSEMVCSTKQKQCYDSCK